MIFKILKAILIVMRVGPEKILGLEEDARRDPLTNLLNRRGLQERLENEKNRSDRYGRPFLVVYIDIDNLKEVNDREGHDRGDKLIISVAEMIKSNCRSTDFAARVGGDEFVVIFTETDEDGAEAALKRLRSSWNISMGHSQYYKGASMDDVMQTAETKMREDKKRRKAKGRDD